MEATRFPAEGFNTVASNLDAKSSVRQNVRGSQEFGRDPGHGKRLPMATPGWRFSRFLSRFGSARDRFIPVEEPHSINIYYSAQRIL